MSDDIKLAAFVAPDLQIAGQKLRPLSAGSLIILKLTGNKLIEVGSDLEGVEYHVASFLYIHAAPAPEVRKASSDPAVFRNAVIEYAEGLSIADFVKAANDIRQVIENSVVGSDYEVKSDEDKPLPKLMRPSWAASYLVSIANHTGWSRDFILWELPFGQGLQLQHAILLINGAKTVKPEASALTELDRLTEMLNQ